MLLAKWIGCLLITLGTVTVLAAQVKPNPPQPAPSPKVMAQSNNNPTQAVAPGEPTPANIRDWHCEAQMFDLGSPTSAYKTLYFAVKCKNLATVKKVLSAETVRFITGVAAMQKKPFDEAIGNGLSESTLSPTLPQMCKERVKDKMGAVEVNGRGKWEDLPFILEDGVWKLAVGDIFNGSYQSPSAVVCTPPMPMQTMPVPRTATPMPPVQPGPKAIPPTTAPPKP